MNTRSQETWEKIAAFADGELTGEQCCELLEEAMRHPDHARRVAYQQQLRKLMAGCMDCETMRCPEELACCVEALADEHCCDPACAEPAVASGDHSAENHSKSWASERFPGGGHAPGPSVLAKLNRWLPLAAAAVLFLAAVGVYTASMRDSGGGGGSGGAAGFVSGVIPASLVNNFEQRHVRCASGIVTPHDSERFPKNVKELAPALAERFGTPVSGITFDLSRIGYHYSIAGLCVVPGKGSVHVIYTADPAPGSAPGNTPGNTPGDVSAGAGTSGGSRQSSLSLWIKPYNAATDPDIAAAKLYVAADDNAPHPVVLWRDDAMIYYLVGDSMSQVQQAQQLLASRS